VQRPSKQSVGTISSKLSSDQYSEKKALELFESYRDEEVTDEKVIGPEGLERLCSDAQLEMEGPKPLLLAWLLEAKDMGRFTRDEWSSGTSKWRTDTTSRIATLVNDLHDLLFTSDRNLSPQTGKSKPKAGDSYNRSIFSEYVSNPPSAYKKFYAFTFELAKSEHARNIDMEIATALWSVVLSPKYPQCNGLIDFINEKKTYKGVNKDVWSMTLEFCEEVDMDKLDSYDSEEASWPVMLDEFVAYSKEHSTNNRMEMN